MQTHTRKKYRSLARSWARKAANQTEDDLAYMDWRLRQLGEEWRPIPKWPPYEVSNFKRVRWGPTGDIIKERTKMGEPYVHLRSGRKKANLRPSHLWSLVWKDEPLTTTR